MAVNGKFLPASKSQPRHSCTGLLNFLSAATVALPSKILLLVFTGEVFDEDLRTICAFCFRTSAGVRMKHDTISAVEEAMAFITGAGRSEAPEERGGLEV